MLFILFIVQAAVNFSSQSEIPHETCKRNFKKIGCYAEDVNTFTDLLVNDREAGANGLVIDWKNFFASTHSLACRCARAAKAKNYKHIAIRFYGLCFGSHHKTLSGSTSNECVNGAFKSCIDKHEDECAGKSGNEYVYELTDGNHDVNGGFGAWSSFSECSTTCGGGIMTRERLCNNPEPSGHGLDCSVFGSYTQGIACTNKRCVTGCEFKPNDGSGGTEKYIGTFSNKHECVKQCLERQRTDTSINGVTVDAATGKKCYCEQGMTGRTGSNSWKSCFIKLLYRDGGYTEWTKFSRCVTCSTSEVVYRTRNCSNPTPIGEGKDCTMLGPSREEKHCDVAICKSGCEFKPNDGSGGTEKYIGTFSNKHECVKQCLERQRTDTSINGVTVDAATGKKCYCEQGMTGRTGSNSWKSCFIKLLYRDGGYTEWTKFSRCVTCSTSEVVYRTRNCSNPTPIGEGKDCTMLGPSRDEKHCDVAICKSVCTFQPNDGTGGSEKFIGKFENPQQCVLECTKLRASDPSINGVTVDASTGTSCYCEMKMTGRNDNNTWKSCFLPSE